MTNQSSIKYISSLLDNPASISEGDQSSIALFRQTFPYFVPGRYLVALESHKKAPYSTAMLSAMQPYMGDWILFCDFLQNGAASHSKYMPVSNAGAAIDLPVNKVVDKKMVEVQPPMPEPEVIVTAKPEVLIEQHVAAAVAVENKQSPVIVTPEKEDIPTPLLHETPVFNVPEEEVAQPPKKSVVETVITEEKTPAQEEVQPAIVVAVMAETQPVVAVAPPVTFEELVPAPAEAEAAIVTVPFVEEAPPVLPVAGTTVVEEQAHVPVEEQPVVDPVPGSMGYAPQGVVMEDYGYVQAEDQSVPAKTLIVEPLPLVPMPMAVVIEEDIEDEEYGHTETIAANEETLIEEDMVFVEEDDRFSYTDTVLEEEAVEIVNDTDPNFTEPATEKREQDPLIFPIYTKDYFLQQGEKVSEEIPLEINELKDADDTSEEDTSLMVVMSFSEWLLHFKNSAEKQKEETKDQKALKTMWQKEKLAAAMEEENEEIPENVFEMAVNSISKEEGLASETLAEIYMKQGKYDKAIEMYRKLSLRNPQKNVYFARKIEEALKDKQS